ncbi:MAG: mechanosensitive ion channel [Phycisphaeraceae bacterium]|nr:mechanosensitive ion channel [Phycisphaeraceae bacterium]
MEQAPGRVRAALLMVAAAAICWLAAVNAHAQPAVPPDPPRLEVVEQRLAALAERTDLPETARTELTGLLQQTMDALRSAQGFEAQIAEYDRLIAESPALLERIRAELSDPPPAPVVDLPAGATVQEAEQRLADAQAELAAAREELARLEAEPERRSQRRTEIAQLVAQGRARLAELDERISLVPASEDEVERARLDLLLAQRRALASEITSYEKERGRYDARREVLPEQRNRAARRVAILESAVSAWQAEAQERRRRQAEEQAREAQRLRREAAALTPALRELAEQNQEIADARTGRDGIAERLAEARAELTALPQETGRLQREFDSVSRKVDTAGVTSAVGQLLRRQLDRLPDESLLRQRARERRTAVSDSQIQLLLADEMSAEIRDESRYVTELIARLSPPPAEVEEQAIRELARELLAQRRALLAALTEDHELYVERIAPELDALNRHLLLATEQFRGYVERRILWLRSVRGGVLPNPAQAWQAARWLVASPEWPEAARRAWQRSTTDTLATGLSALLLLLLGSASPWATRRLAALAESCRRFTTDSYGLTIRALGLTALKAAPIPAALLLLGWWIAAPAEQVEIGRASGPALRRAAYVLFALLMAWHTMKPNGLAEAHFRWPTATVRRVRRHMFWFLCATGPIVFVVGAIDRQTVSEAWNESLGRIAFIAGLVALAGVTQRLFRPTGPIGVYFTTSNRGGWMDRLKWVWYPLLVGAPIALCVLSLAGYHYTAHELAVRLVDSILLLMFLVLVYAMLLRWLFVERRRLAIARAKERRAAAQEQEESGVEAPPITDERELEVPVIDAQTRQLIRAVVAVSVVIGLYSVWAGTLPALRVLDRVQVWPTVRMLDSAFTDDVSALVGQVSVDPIHAAHAPAILAAPGPGASAPNIPGVPPLTPSQGSSEGDLAAAIPASVTLADLGAAALLVLLTAVLARNVPGLLEITLLKRLPMDAGSRYAVSTVARYLILIVGVTAVFSALGIGWSKVQWLAAALTFGLAFGLQEIFANFISGLIILAERPIRVGDVVTIGNVSGTVARIRMRATTILDWDRKELIVPNKAFITDQIINWSLSDPTLRLTTTIGVAYGSDTALVERTLLAVANANENVLRDPAPTVVFQRFGESSLDFELRVFLPAIDRLVPTRHQLHLAIDAAFREAGIEIAFPQRDLHLRSVEGVFTVAKDGSIRRAEDGAAS